MMATWLEEHGVELVVLAGYMHLLTKPFLDRFSDRIVNVHPSLLPQFPGGHAIDDALAAGVETTGVTIHLVDEGLDTGAVLRQETVPLEPRETLEERLHAVEHRLLPAVVREMIAAVRALLSVYDKTGTRRVRGRGSSSSASSSCPPAAPPTTSRRPGFAVTRVEEVTSAPEMLAGRVKTLHPNIHAGILARRDIPEDMDTLAEHGIEPFDLVCVNLYPVRLDDRAARGDRCGGRGDDRRRRPVDAA